LFNVVLVVVVLLHQLIIGKASSLAKHAHPLSEISRLEEGGVGSNPVISCGDGRIEIRELNHVGSVSSRSSFSSVSGRVSVTSSPLEVDVVSLSSNKESGNKVVLGGRVGLHDVSSLSSDVNVEDPLKERDSRRSWSDVEDVRSVLEGSSELSCVEGHRHVQTILSKSGVLGNGRVSCIGSPVDEATVWSVSRSSQIRCGDVVSHSEDTVAVVVSNATLLGSQGDGPVETSLEAINAVTQVVVSGPSALNANWGRNAESRDHSPIVSVGLAVNLVVLGSCSSSLILAFVPALDVLGFSLVE